MKLDDWNILDVGDVIEHPEHGRYQVARLQDGKVLAVQLAGTQKDASGITITTTRTVEVPDPNNLWERVSWKDGSYTARPRVALEGGFLVRRADGTEEYDRCPSPIEKSRKTPRQV